MRRCSEHHDEFDAAFDALLARSQAEYATKQEAFLLEVTSYKKYSYKFATSTFELRSSFFDRKRSLFTPVGTFTPTSKTWQWAWSIESLKPEIRERCAAIRKLWDETNYVIFRDPTFRVDYSEVDELCALALHALNGRGIFKAEQAEPWVYLLVH